MPAPQEGRRSGFIPPEQEKRSLWKLGERRLANLDNSLMLITSIEGVPGVSYDITVVRDRYFSGLGGWRHIEEHTLLTELTKVENTTELRNLRSAMNERRLRPEREVVAGVLQAFKLGGEMLEKYADMHHALRIVTESNPSLYPAELVQNKDQWLTYSEFYGGLKSVLIIDHRDEYDNMTVRQRDLLLEQHAQHINQLNTMGGDPRSTHYFTAPDMGSTSQDMGKLLDFNTPVACYDGENGTGNPSPTTALGVAYGIRAMVDVLGIPENKRRFAIQGAAGEVGSSLLRFLKQNHPTATFVITDLARRSLELNELAATYGALLVEPDEIFTQGNIFVPSGPPGQLNDETIPAMKEAGVKAVIGPANYLWTAGKEEELAKIAFNQGILVAPAHAVNRGGIQSILQQFTGGTPGLAHASITDVEPMLKEILREALTRNVTPDQVAREIALQEYALACRKRGLL